MARHAYGLVGTDPFTQLEKLGEIQRQLGKDVQRVDFDGETAELSDVLDELRSFAMFASAKLVVIRDAGEFVSRFREQLENYLEKPSTSGTLVLRLNSLPKTQRIHKILAKNGGVIECAPPPDLRRWITEQARSVHGLSVPPDAATLLAELIGADLGRLDNELAKLALQVDTATVTAQQIRHVAFQREQEMWDMTNELASGKPQDALRRWRNLVRTEPSTEFRAAVWLTMWLEDMRMALSGRTGRLGWKYKDRLPLLVQTARKFGKAGIARATDLLAELDRRSKSGLGDGSTNVERFILSLAE
jgi:DNA polymerase III delta subunit